MNVPSIHQLILIKDISCYVLCHQNCWSFFFSSTFGSTDTIHCCKTRKCAVSDVDEKRLWIKNSALRSISLVRDTHYCAMLPGKKKARIIQSSLSLAHESSLLWDGNVCTLECEFSCQSDVNFELWKKWIIVDTRIELERVENCFNAKLPNFISLNHLNSLNFSVARNSNLNWKAALKNQ